jgi:phage FluMu protein Com
VSAYRCKHCGKTVQRDSDKAWIKSYCDDTDRDVHLMRVKEPGGGE